MFWKVVIQDVSCTDFTFSGLCLNAALENLPLGDGHAVVVHLAVGEEAAAVEAGRRRAEQPLEPRQGSPPGCRVPLLQLRHLLVQEVL